MPAQPPRSSASDRNAYIPQHVQQAMAKQMQQTMPAHMQQYVGAFMQQNVVNPGAAASTPWSSTNTNASPSQYRPVTNLPRESHYQQYGRPKGTLYPSAGPGGAPVPPQPQVTLPGDQPQAPPPLTPQSPASAPMEPTPNPNQQPNYDFIMDSTQAPKKVSLPGSGSTFGRVAFIGGGLVVLLIVFSILSNVLKGPSAVPAYVGVAQSQQELIYLTTSALEQESLSADNRNLASTAQLSLTSSQANLIQYLADSGHTVDAKQLNLKLDPEVDKRLETAAAATTYNTTFREIMKAELIDYSAAMQRTYDQFKAPKGRALLTENYRQAQLMIDQLGQGDQSN